MADLPEIVTEQVSCALCKEDKFDLIMKARDYRFGHDQEYKVVQCQQCGLLMTNPRPNMAGIEELYKYYYTPLEERVEPYRSTSTGLKGLMWQLWHLWTGQCRERIPARGRVLDVGCGYGHFLAIFAERGLEVYGVELNPLAAEACRQRGLSVFCGSLEGAAFSDASFDIVLMYQVIEHLPDPLETLGEIHRLLAPGGEVHILCPNADSYLIPWAGRYWHGWHLPFHFYHFTRETLRLLAEKASFSLASLRTVTPVNCFSVSLKAFLYSRKMDNTPTIIRGKIFDSIPARALFSLPLRFLDMVLPSRGDCLWAVLKKD